MLISSENGRTHPIIDEEKLTDDDLPLGQKILKAGYKVITMGKIEERFCCDKITEGEIKKAEKRIVKQINEFRASHWWRKNARFKIEILEVYSFIRASNWCESKTIDENYLNCVLETKHIDDYVANTIPERCLISLKKARQIGMSFFNVVYPVLGHKRFKDPIIVGATNEKFDPMYEVDFWE